jgi:hypothetical protein
MEMLRMISFSLFVQSDQYERYRCSLYSHMVPASVEAAQGPAPPPPVGLTEQQAANASVVAGAAASADPMVD